jgi:hypothetical protein
MLLGIGSRIRYGVVPGRTLAAGKRTGLHANGSILKPPWGNPFVAVHGDWEYSADEC